MSHLRSTSSRPRAVPQPTLKLGRGERTRAMILDAALEFLWSNPFREMTVRSVMESTNLSRSAFYRHFHDLHQVMESLLLDLEQEILRGAAPWLTRPGPPLDLLHESLSGLVRVCYQRGPILRAIVDAAPTDERLDRIWNGFLERFDVAVESRIEEDQRQGLIREVDARSMAVALNRLDVAELAAAFGRRPRRTSGPVFDVLFRIWSSALYGPKPQDPGARSQ